MSFWSLTANGQTKSLAAWGIEQFSAQFISQQTSQLAFPIRVQSFDQAQTFADGASLVLLRDGAAWWRGKIKSTNCLMRAESQSHQYTAVDAWYWMENNDFQIEWAYFYKGSGDPTYTQVTGNSPHLLLFLGPTGQLLTTKAQIQAVLAWAESRNAGLQAGTIDLPNVYLPVAELRDRSCAEVFRDCLRPHPEAVAWFDYSTDPPSLNIKQASSLSSVALAKGQAGLESLEIMPQTDLQRSAVVIRYERVATVNGIQQRSIDIDRAPVDATGLEDGALNYSFNLRGVQMQVGSGTITTVPMPATDTDWLVWFMDKFTWLKDASSTNVRFVSGTAVVRTGALGLGYELVEGEIAPWMQVSGSPIEYESEEARAWIQVDVVVGGKIVSRQRKLFTQQFTSTSAPSGTYQGVSSFTPEEPVPLGLAAHELALRSVLHYGGVGTLAEEQHSGAVALGKKLNLTGFTQSAWASMNEPLQRVGVQVTAERQETSFQFGPPSQLWTPELVSLLRGG